MFDYDRFFDAGYRKRQLAGLIDELIARFELDATRSQFVAMYEPSVQAAPLAGSLGFPVPPVEYRVVQRPESHPLLDANPYYTLVNVFRVHDPHGLTYVDVDLSASEANEGAPKVPARLPPPEPVKMANIKAMLQSWKRAVDRLDERDVTIEPRPPQAVSSIQMYLFVMGAARARKGPLDPDSDAARQQREFQEYLTNPEVVRSIEQSMKEASKASRLAAIVEPEPAVPGNGTQPATGTAKRQEKVSWTKPDVDSAIRDYKAKRAGPYGKYARAIEKASGKKQATLIKKARGIFGRNVIATVLNCPKAMVSNSQPWKAMRAELHLERRKKYLQKKRTGFDAAVEEASVTRDRRERLSKTDQAEIEEKLKGRGFDDVEPAANDLLGESDDLNDSDTD